jgi:hypothetical protein
MRLDPTDTDRSWFVDITPERVTVLDDESREPSCVVRATASELYLFIWNRRDGTDLAVSGRVDDVDRWRTTVRVRWT